jgi:hypothetical protein
VTARVRRAPFWLLSLLGALVVCPRTGHAESDRLSIDPAAPHALGRVFTAGPDPTALTLLSSAGYGYTESVLGTGDAHHRAAGALALDGRPLPWLDLVLRFDGRYDAHVAPGQATDTGLVGDPRLYVRADKALSPAIRLGARFGLWLPGRNAPSLDAGAISPELVGALSYVPPEGMFALSANAGYRLDRSARSASDAAQLSAGDRLALEVSDFDEVLLGAAATLGRGQTQGFIEASWDLLVGNGHPAALASPILVGAGARVAIGPKLRLEAEAEVSPSSRPDVGPMAPLVPIPPRLAVWLGLTYRFETQPPPTAPPAPVAPPPPPATAELIGHITAADGGKLADLRVAVIRGDGPHEVTLDDAGAFRTEGKPGDELTVTAEAADCVPARATATLSAGAPTELRIALERRAPRGQIRGLVRSLRGSAVAAQIRIEPEAADTGGGSELRAEGGRFEIDVAPGRYRVTISAPGFETQNRKVEVEENGVTLLNVDLRSER